MLKMAKVRSPLFSLAASGSIGGLISFRSNKERATARLKPRSQPQQSEGALLNQQRMKNAAAAFSSLTQAQQIEWSALGISRGKPSWQIFFEQYQAQYITPPSLPEIPEITLR
jgi:hypothetical protein